MQGLLRGAACCEASQRCVRMHVSVCAHVCLSVCTHLCVCAWMCLSVHMCASPCACTCMCYCMCSLVCAHTCISVCVCTFTKANRLSSGMQGQPSSKWREAAGPRIATGTLWVLGALPSLLVRFGRATMCAGQLIEVVLTLTFQNIFQFLRNYYSS